MEIHYFDSLQSVGLARMRAKRVAVALAAQLWALTDASTGSFMPRDCKLKPPYEIMLNAVVAGLMKEGAMPNGSIVDAGAENGRWACYYAATAPGRAVHAIDPDPRFVEMMRRRYTSRKLPNLRPLHGGLSDNAGQYSTNAADQAGRGGKIYTRASGFPLYRLDDLFSAGGMCAGETLAFAHLDVEGGEERVLLGALRTIARDQPVISTELTVHKHPERTRSLLRLLRALGYDTIMVEEIAGNRCDIRNTINLPRSRRRQFQNSNVLDLGVASRALYVVDEDTVNQTAFPCCADGGACCPNPGAFTCCSHQAVHSWMAAAIREGSADLQFTTRTRWYDQESRLAPIRTTRTSHHTARLHSRTSLLLLLFPTHRSLPPHGNPRPVSFPLGGSPRVVVLRQTFQKWKPDLSPRYHREQLLRLRDLSSAGFAEPPSRRNTNGPQDMRGRAARRSRKDGAPEGT